MDGIYMWPIFIYSPVRILDSSVSRPRHTVSWYEGTKTRDISVYPKLWNDTVKHIYLLILHL